LPSDKSPVGKFLEAEFETNLRKRDVRRMSELGGREVRGGSRICGGK